MLLRASGDQITLHGGGPPLGLVHDMEYATAPQEKLVPGDIVLVASDGIAEAESESQEPFGIERMIDVIAANRERSAIAATREFQAEGMMDPGRS